MKDYRKQGPPADIGTFQFTSTAMVFKFTFSGVTYNVAIATGIDGWTLIAPPGVVGAADVEIQAAILYIEGLGGGRLILHMGTYIITAKLIIIEGSFTFRGQNAQATRLLLADGVDDHVISCEPTSAAFFMTFKRFMITGNKDNNAAGDGIHLNTDCNDPLFEDLFLYLCKDNGLVVEKAWNTRIIGITSEYHGNDGLQVLNGNDLKIIASKFITNDRHGATLTGVLTSSISGTYFYNNYNFGLNFAGTQKTIVVGNIFSGNSTQGANVSPGFILQSDCRQCIITSNLFFGNDLTSYGVYISSVASINIIVKNNLFIGQVTAPLRDGGTGTILATHPIPLIQGTAFVSTAGEAWGWEISADTNFALGIGWLPYEVQQVLRIRVIGVALAAPGAGDYMRIQITGEGATFDENFGTEPIDVVDHNNEEVNVAIDDAVNWIFTATEDADIGDLLGGDRLQLKVLHEGAGNGDAETNAIVDSIQIEFV